MINNQLSTLPLLSWIDVARRLAAVPMRSSDLKSPLTPPVGLIASEVFWTGLIISVEATEYIDDINSWLKAIFGTWYTFDGGKSSIKLDGPKSYLYLPVSFDVAGPNTRIPQYRPSASLEGRRSYSINFPDRSITSPTVVAFHSVKGGVGRTTAAMAFAKSMSSTESKSPVLLIDADFEAPGVSYLYRMRKPDVSVSLEDLLALAHADTSPDLSSTIEFAAAQMLDQRIDNIFVLPVKRILDDLTGFTIRPEHLVNARKNQPYLIVDLIRKLAEQLNCHMAVVDLRAGLVDIALHFLTDPSVERVFVSTISGQSTNALKGMLQTLGHVERQVCIAGRQPFVLFNQVPKIKYDDPNFRSELLAKIESQADSAFFIHELANGADNSTVTPARESSLSFGFCAHSSELISLSDDWDSYYSDLENTNFIKDLRSEMNSWLSTRRIGVTPPPLKKTGSDHPANQYEACSLLADFSNKLEFAETADRVERPLITPPIQRLLNDFIHHPPITVIEGTKGTGKTLTFRYFLEHESWRNTARAMKIGSLPTFDGVFLPVLGSINSSDKMLALVNAGRTLLATRLNQISAGIFSETTTKIREGIHKSWNISQWTEFWLEIIAKAAGFDKWTDFVVKAIASDDVRPIAMFEGLEEYFVNPYTETVQADALRALLKEVPIRLREEAGRPIGILIFARSDMVEAVIEQNIQQFRASFRNYALTWRDIDIQELVVWLVANSGAIPDFWTPAWRTKPDSSREEDLRRIWGLKLGSDLGKEARSTEWVVAVLTDLTGRLTARDLVRFINQAAMGSRDQQPVDRLLTANAMRNAVEYTSKQKVDEYPKEVRELMPIFQKLRAITGLATPFDRTEAASNGINSQELDVLEKYGVAYGDEGSFEVPELFRIGLNLKRKGARPNIISLTRKAREKARA